MLLGTMPMQRMIGQDRSLNASDHRFGSKTSVIGDKTVISTVL